MGRVAALQAIAARGGPALVGPGAAAYRALAESAAAYVRRRTGANVYARGSLARGEVVPGLSDLDLVAVLPEPAPRPELALALLALRRRIVSERFPTLARLVTVAVYGEQELRSALGSTTLTWALEREAPGGPRAQALHFRSAAPEDELGLRGRPGVPPGTAGWVALGSAPPAPAGAGPEPLHVAWLELQYWWRHAWRLALDPGGPVAHYTSVKLVAEAARTWLWLSDGRAPATRREALELSDDPAAATALAVEQRLPGAGPAPVAEALAALARASRRVAGRVRERADAAGYDHVRLLGAAPQEGLLPLADWRARTFSEPPDERCFVAGGDPADPGALAAAIASAGPGRQPLLVSDDVLVAPSARALPPRGLECPATDPVTFALLEGADAAAFPRLPGWSARDGARRAVAEHRSWLAGWLREPAPTARALGLLLTAARVAYFLETIEAGDPELPLTVAATVEALGWPASGLEDVASATELVRALPAYAGV